MSTRIVVADDHEIVREGLCSLLDGQADFEVVGRARGGRTTVQMARDLRPSVVVMDIAMPLLNGIEATRQIAEDCPDVKVIALSMHSDRRYVARMLQAGASGYLLKDSAIEELVRAIRAVIAGHTYLSPSVAGSVVDDYVNQLTAASADSLAGLTDREREVLQLMAEGVATKQIASRLHVSVKTVETHRQHIMSKLDIHSVAELTKFAVREGLTSLDG